jgi:hypothetical protein
MQVERNNFDALVENHLPDGSRMIVDSENEKVYALNATAGAAWDACSGPTTLSGVTESMKHTFGPEMTEDVAEQAILQLQEQNLVATSGGAKGPSRRQLLMAMGAVALPVVVSLTMADQRAYADQARSTVCAPPQTPPPGRGWGFGEPQSPPPPFKRL